MKKILIILFFLPLFSISQSKKDTTICLPINGDTVDISKVKFLKFSKGITQRELLEKTDFYLSKQDIEQLISILGQLPYNESHSAIEKIKQLFGLEQPKK